MGFNSNDYIDGQITKQYIRPLESAYKVSFDHKEFAVDETLMKKVIHSDIKTLQGMVRDNELTYAELVKCFWNQVVRMRDYNAVISLDTGIVEKAEAMSYDESHDLLYGMPVLVKDNVNMSGIPTTAGAAILKEHMADADAELVTRLKGKGALILGKTNLSEWANFMSTESSNGYSAIGGQTKNASGQFDVGGSSAGSAVAAALSMAPATVGTETSGSVIYPASQNGVVGLKPTLGSVSQDGIIPISKTHDTAGPMAKTVQDVYVLFKGMSSAEDDARWDIQVKDLKAGIIGNEELKTIYRKEDEDVLRSLQQKLKQGGAECADLVVEEAALEINYFSILKHEFKQGIRDFFASPQESAMTLEEIASFNEKDLDNTAPYNQELLKQSLAGGWVSRDIEELISSNQKTARHALDKAFEEVDVLITLSNYGTVLYAASGYPAVTIPGYTRSTGEPIGVTLIGKSGQDVKLLEIANAVEQMIK